MSSRWHWGTAIALVYSLFAAGSLGMVAIAVTQRTDLVSPDYYARALRHDDRQAARARAHALGATFTAVADDATFRLHWPHAATDVVLTWYRPSNADADRSMSLAPRAVASGSEQTIPIDDLDPGVWHAQVSWHWQGHAYYAERVVTRYVERK